MDRQRVGNITFKLISFGFCICFVLVSWLYASEGLDKTKYISVDEIEPGMEAYCLTTYKGTEIEKFGLEVLSVVKNFWPERDIILVQGTDERFIHTGPVAGCSGSPVYIEGRMAGALAYSVSFSKDPLYVVTPIKDILEVGQFSDSKRSVEPAGFMFDFSKPIDFDEIDKQITVPKRPVSNSFASISPLPCPLIVSGLPSSACEQLNASIEPFGFLVVSGPSGGSSKVEGSGDIQLVPGATVAIPLVTGDISLEAVGTVTEVIGDEVYIMGHSELGYGSIDLPMATGYVHTVVSSLLRSFKLATALDIVGALRVDEFAAVRGQIGAQARMIPLTIKIDRYNDIKRREYKCQLANSRIFTPMMIQATVAGTILQLGNLPPEHMIEYKVNIEIEGAEAISFENVSTALGLKEVLVETMGCVAIVMNNPYERVNIKSIEFEARIVQENIISHIWSVDLSDSKVRAGEEVEVGVIVESFLGGKKKYQCSLDIPDDLGPGVYDLIVMGGYNYRDFLRKNTPYRFIPQNMSSLVEVLNNLLTIRKDKLYCILILPSGGVAVERAELPDLPATKAMVLGDVKRTLKLSPYLRWIEKSFDAGSVVVDKKVLQVMVEE